MDEGEELEEEVLSLVDQFEKSVEDVVDGG